MAPWADVLYACDIDWWRKYGGVPDFHGLKIGLDAHKHEPKWDVRTVCCVKGDDRLRLSQFGVVGWGGNSGFHAINLAVQFGVRRIILVGYDMTLANGLHWHGKHVHGLNNPTQGNVNRWRICVDAAADTLRDVGVEVVNASPISALRNYPKMTLEEALCR